MAPVTGAGLLTAALAAFVTNRRFVRADATGETAQFVQDSSSAQAPLAFSLALVLLACWGVVLVSGTRVRRIVLVVGALAGAGATVASVLARGAAASALTEDYADVGARAETSTTVWFYLAVAASASATLVCAFAVGRVTSWPQMSARYDAPTADSTSGPAEAPAQPEGRRGDVSQPAPGTHDLWKSLDRGEDPTDHQ